MVRSYTWEHGRQLAAVTQNGTTWTYTYDANGLRTRKTEGTVTYNYVYNGSQLTALTIENASTNARLELLFTYDASGSPLTVTTDGETFYYVTNLQGDVTAILNADGDDVASYSYTTYGDVGIVMGHVIAVFNPLLYRGYVFDMETDLYYCQSRYYDPTVGRFINADALISTGQGLLGNNMFAYCLNNPVNLVDDAGESATLTANPNSSFYEDTTGGGGGGGIILGTLTLVDSLWDSISRSYARSKSRTYKSPEEEHHLVARMAWNAAPAAAILEELFPGGVENPINKISIKTGLHRRLHRKLYYGIANALVITAYNSTNDPIQQQQNVVFALGILRGIVSYLNTLAPY